jgi:hypothetical protein
VRERERERDKEREREREGGERERESAATGNSWHSAVGRPPIRLPDSAVCASQSLVAAAMKICTRIWDQVGTENETDAVEVLGYNKVMHFVLRERESERERERERERREEDVVDAQVLLFTLVLFQPAPSFLLSCSRGLPGLSSCSSLCALQPNWVFTPSTTTNPSSFSLYLALVEKEKSITTAAACLPAWPVRPSVRPSVGRLRCRWLRMDEGYDAISAKLYFARKVLSDHCTACIARMRAVVLSCSCTFVQLSCVPAAGLCS